MNSFDQCVTDPAVTKTGVEAFMAETAPGARLFLGQYLVCTTSGITGFPGIFLHDQAAVTTYQALVLIRSALPWGMSRRLERVLREGGRIAVLMATDGHSVDEALMGYASQRYPWLTSHYLRAFSIQRPMAELTDRLNAFQPAVLVGYATALDALAKQQQAGWLKIAPRLAVTSAEWLAPAARERLGAAFSCSVRDLYSATEFPGIASECEHGTLHVNSDWVLLEPGT